MGAIVFGYAGRWMRVTIARWESITSTINHRMFRALPVCLTGVDNGWRDNGNRFACKQNPIVSSLLWRSESTEWVYLFKKTFVLVKQEWRLFKVSCCNHGVPVFGGVSLRCSLISSLQVSQLSCALLKASVHPVAIQWLHGLSHLILLQCNVDGHDLHTMQNCHLFMQSTKQIKNETKRPAVSCIAS